MFIASSNKKAPVDATKVAAAKKRRKATTTVIPKKGKKKEKNLTAVPVTSTKSGK